MSLFFLDTEFIEDGRTIDLVSIALVCEDGRELYRCSTEARLDLANDWVRQNVLPKLPPYSSAQWMSRLSIRDDVRHFVGGSMSDPPEIWAYYADYDWVALCQLFGPMIDLPLHWPKWCRDLKQLSADLGNPPHPPNKGEHDALEDARWGLALHKHLQSYRRGFQVP